MPQEAQDGWGKLFGGDSTPGPPKVQSKSGQDGWGKLFGSPEPIPGKDATLPSSDKPGFLTRSVFSWGGKTASEAFQGSEIRKQIEKIVPEDWRKDHGDWTGQYLASLAQAAPEAFDFATSPAGLAIIGVHLIPQTRGLAAVADMALTAWQGASALEAIDKFQKTHSPEDAAAATASLIFTYMGRKAFTKTEAAIQAGAKGEPILKDTIPMREDIMTQPTLTDKIAALDKAADPSNKNFWKKQASKLYSVPLVDQIASMAQVPKTDLLDVSQKIVRTWAENRAEQNLKISQFLAPLRHTVPESEATVFTIEPDGTFKSTKGIHSVIESKADPAKTSLSSEGKQAVTDIRAKTEDFKKHIIKEHSDPEIEKKLIDAEEYVRHFWIFGDEGVSGEGKTNSRTSPAVRALRDRFLQGKRVIDTIDEGLEISNRQFKEDPTAPRMTPRYNNIFDIKREEWRYSAHVIENQRAANLFKEMGAVISEDQHKDLGLNWPKSDAEQLKTAVYKGKKVSQKSAEERTKVRKFRGEPMTTITTKKEYRPVYIHPGVKMAMDALFDSPITRRTTLIGPPFAALQQLSSFGKTFKLGVSLFHENTVALVGAAIQVTRGGIKGVGKAFKQIYVANPEWWRGNKATFFELIGKPISLEDEPRQIRTKGSEVEFPVRMGLNLHTEENLAATRSALINMGRDSKYGKVVAAPLRMFGYLNHMIQKPLWDYYHPSVMLDAFHTIYADELNHLGKNATPEQTEALARAVADHVNNVSGSVNYDVLMTHPKMRQVMGLAWLAPGWTMSIGRTVSQGFEGVTQARLARHYYIGAIATWFMANQILNYASTSWNNDKDKDGKEGGHFTWGNAGLPIKVLGRDTGFTDNFFNIQAGRNPNGTERYIEIGKPYRELADWFIDPQQTAENKWNPWLKSLEMAWYGIDPQTDFKVRDEYGSDTVKFLQTAQLLADAFTPMSLDGVIKLSEHKAFPEIFPVQMTRGTLLESTVTGVAGVTTKTGESTKKLQAAFIHAMDAQDQFAAAGVLLLADRNNISRGSIVKAYRDAVRSRMLKKLGPRQYDEKGNRITE